MQTKHIDGHEKANRWFLQFRDVLKNSTYLLNTATKCRLV